MPFAAFIPLASRPWAPTAFSSACRNTCRIPSLAVSSASSKFVADCLRSQRPDLATTPPCYHKSTIQCYAESDGGSDDDDDYDEEPDILLKEDASDRVLPVGIQHNIEHNGVNYVVCYPIDDPVAFARSSHSGELEAIDDRTVVQKLFPNAEAVLAEDHIALKDTPFVLTVDDLREGIDDGDDGDGDDHEDGDDDDDDVSLGDDHAVEVLAEFLSDGEQFFVVRPVDEVLLVAKEGGDGEGKNYSVLTDSELERIAPVVEEFVEAFGEQSNL